MGTLREAVASKGNFGIGSVGDVQQAKALGDLWVGNGARSLKSDGTMQANFEAKDAAGNVTANAHLDIRPGGGINVSPEYIRGTGTPPVNK